MLFQQSFGYFRKVIGRVSAQRNLCLVFATGLYEFKFHVSEKFLYFSLAKIDSKNRTHVIMVLLFCCSVTRLQYFLFDFDK